MDTQSSFKFVRNDLYVDHKIIMSMIQSRFKSIDFDEEDVMNFCQECEKQIGDVENMVKYIEIPLEIERFYKAKLPCNIFRILDVYTTPKNNESRVAFNRPQDGRYLFFNPDLRLTTVYINYIGNPVNEDGIPLIVRGHELACMYYSLYNGMMEKALLGELNANVWQMIRNESPLRIAEAIGSVRHMTHDDWNHLNIIQGNMVPKIGEISLLNTKFK